MYSPIIVLVYLLVTWLRLGSMGMHITTVHISVHEQCIPLSKPSPAVVLTIPVIVMSALLHIGGCDGCKSAFR